MNYLRKLFILMVACILGISTISYGDIIMKEPVSLIERYTGFAICAGILCVALLLSMLCLFNGKIKKIDTLKNKSKTVAENVLFYLLVEAVIFIIYIGFNITQIVAVAVLILVLILRIIFKRKKTAYVILGIAIGLVTVEQCIVEMNGETSIILKKDWQYKYVHHGTLGMDLPEIEEEEDAIVRGNEVKIYSFEGDEKIGYQVFLNLDYKSKKENISLSKIEIDEGTGTEYMDVFINGKSIRFTAVGIVREVVAFQIDGSGILLGVHADGASNDYYSEIYSYNNGKIKKVGQFNCDISLLKKEKTVQIYREKNQLVCKVEEGTLLNYIYKVYNWEETKFVEAKTDQYLYLDTELELKLKKDIVVYEKQDKKSKSLKLKKQSVYAIKKGLGNWNYIKGKDGTEGWFELDITEYDKIFANSYLAG